MELNLYTYYAHENESRNKRERSKRIRFTFASFRLFLQFVWIFMKQWIWVNIVWRNKMTQISVFQT